MHVPGAIGHLFCFSESALSFGREARQHRDNVLVLPVCLNKEQWAGDVLLFDSRDAVVPWGGLLQKSMPM